MQDNEIAKKIYDYSLEELMSVRFGSYCKTIIQDRAIPDARDGMKPVQRRILFSMFKDKNTYDKDYRKSAKAVGNVMGNYHPHGDSSIYDALVRMSQDWKLNTPYVDMQGNNGSMDGDPPAASRYTEARLSKIAGELLRDIDKDTVVYAPTYDDKALEPTVLPARFPNLLVNGSTGISAGYATDIPPHNLGEVIDACIERIDNPSCTLESIMQHIKAPDFPTGGIIEGIEGVKQAYKTGKGKIVVKSKIDIIPGKGCTQLVVSEIPYEVNKANLAKRIEDIRIEKKIEGIIEARDESDREGLRLVIDIKKDANIELITNYLLKNTELQINYNFNMIAIVNRRPKLLGLLDCLDAYLAHQKEVITKRTEFDLAHAKERYHLIEGLIKAISILDDVIKTIRASKNKADAQTNLVNQYGFTDKQAKAIVELQLYRLTNTDIEELETELASLEKIMAGLSAILSSETKMKNVMKKELLDIKNEYATPRKTEVREEVTELKIDTTSLIKEEEVIVVVTNEGYVKRVSKRSYNSSKDEGTALKQGDSVKHIYELNTLDVILMFTNLGNYLYVPVYEIPELKWKELGTHISNIITLQSNEKIVETILSGNFENKIITFFTKDGMTKRTNINEFKVQRYSKPINCMSLKNDDLLVSVTDSSDSNVLVVTNNGYGLIYDVSEIPVVGLKASGVKSINLKDDFVIGGHVYEHQEFVSLITDKGHGKRVRIIDIPITSRAKRGIQLIREVKSNLNKFVASFVVDPKSIVSIKTEKEDFAIKLNSLPIVDRSSVGSSITKNKILEVSLIGDEVISSKQIEDDIEELHIEENIDLKEIDEKILTIDDFLDDIDY